MKKLEAPAHHRSCREGSSSSSSQLSDKSDDDRGEWGVPRSQPAKDGSGSLVAEIKLLDKSQRVSRVSGKEYLRCLACGSNPRRVTFLETEIKSLDWSEYGF